jgi:hypothetical protein
MRDQVVLTGILIAALGGFPSIATAAEPSVPRPGVAGQNPPWIGELPTVSVVQAAIHGANPHETAVRVSAALEVLENFVYVLSGNSDPGPGRHGCPWPDGGKRTLEYQRAKYMVLQEVTSREPPVPGRNLRFYAEIERSHLAENKKFAGEVLEKFVSRSSRDAYFVAAANWYERLDAVNAAVEARRDPGSTADLDCASARVEQAYGNTEQAEQLRAKCEGRKRAAAARANAERMGAKDVAKARAVGISTNVFGMPLGEPFTIPDCPQGAMGDIGASLSGATCRSQTFSTEEGFSEIILSDSKRPSWVTSAGVAVDAGILMGVAIATTDGDPADQIAVLRAKYGKARPAGNALEWHYPGLYVRYEPRAAIPEVPDQITATTVGGITNFHVGPNVFATWRRANIPNLFIILESLHDAQKGAQQRLKAQEPSL